MSGFVFDIGLIKPLNPADNVDPVDNVDNVDEPDQDQSQVEKKVPLTIGVPAPQSPIQQQITPMPQINSRPSPPSQVNSIPTPPSQVNSIPTPPVNSRPTPPQVNSRPTPPPVNSRPTPPQVNSRPTPPVNSTSTSIPVNSTLQPNMQPNMQPNIQEEYQYREEKTIQTLGKSSPFIRIAKLELPETLDIPEELRGISVYDQISQDETTLKDFLTTSEFSVIEETSITEISEFNKIAKIIQNKLGEYGPTDIIIDIPNRGSKNITKNFKDMYQNMLNYIKSSQSKIRGIRDKFHNTSITELPEELETSNTVKLKLNPNTELYTNLFIVDKEELMRRLEIFNQKVEEHNKKFLERQIKPLTDEQIETIKGKIISIKDQWSLDIYNVQVNKIGAVRYFELAKDVVEIKTLNDYARTVLFNVKNVRIYFELIKLVVDKAILEKGTNRRVLEHAPEPVSAENSSQRLSQVSENGAIGGSNKKSMTKYRYSDGKLYTLRKNQNNRIFIIVNGKKIFLSE